jgi:hypothetical protein
MQQMNSIQQIRSGFFKAANEFSALSFAVHFSERIREYPTPSSPRSGAVQVKNRGAGEFAPNPSVETDGKG